MQSDGIGAFVVSDGLEKQQAVIEKVSEKGKIMTHFTLVCVLMDWRRGEGEPLEDAQQVKWLTPAEAEKLANDPAARKQIEAANAAEEAARQLAAARNFFNNGAEAEARRQLQEIIRTYPDSSSAEDARRLLEKLGR